MDAEGRQGIGTGSTDEVWALDLLTGMSLAQKAAAVLLVLPGCTPEGQPDAATLAAVEAGIGVLHGLRGLRVSQAARYHLAVHDHAQAAGVPAPLITSNLECGIGYSLGSGGTQFPYPLGIGWADDSGAAYRMALALAREARTAGFHWILGPCVDVLTVANDPIIGIRSYGSDPDLVGRLGAAQIRGFQDGGLLSCAKHYPGHGDSATDSHRDLPVVERSRDDHENRHLPPFRAAVEAGVGSVMTAHVTLPGLGVDGPASLDGGLHAALRDDLGFDGIVITDDLRMGAVGHRLAPAEAAVAALHAGADVANVKDTTADVRQVIGAIVRAVGTGELTEAGLDRSVLRLLRARTRLGLHLGHGIQLEAATNLDRARSWDDPSITAMVAVTDRAGVLPLPVPAGSAVRLLVPEGDRAIALADVIADWTGADVRVDPYGPKPGTDRRPGETVIYAVTPPLPGTDQDLPTSEELADVDAVIVLRPTPSTTAPAGPPVVCAPAIDAFDVLTGAALQGAVRRTLARDAPDAVGAEPSITPVEKRNVDE